MYDLVGFGKEIKALRKLANLTQLEVAKKINMHRDTFKRLENGESLPKIETLDRLSIIYQKDIYLLFSNYRFTVDGYISKHIGKVSQHFRNYDFEKINEEASQFEKLLSQTNLYEDNYSKKKINQYKVYLQGLANYSSSVDDKSRDLITKLFLSLELTQNEIKNKRLHLDKLEIRIIILLTIVYRFKNEFVSTIELLDIVYRELIESYKNDAEFLYFYILIQYNRMTYYHRIDDNLKLDSLYRDSLGVIHEAIGIHNLSYFLIRAGINKHLLKEPHLDGFVQTGLQLLKDNQDLPKFESNLKSLEKNYDFLDLKILYSEEL